MHSPNSLIKLAVLAFCDRVLKLAADHLKEVPRENGKVVLRA
jgi:hypothetical protein